MEELQKLKKQTKIFKKIAITLLIIDLILFTIFYIGIKRKQEIGPSVIPRNTEVEMFNARFTRIFGNTSNC